ncbi:MAG: ATP-binding protein [Deltaproteobacteria bacterium]|nr:ATP-binding protein [Deltaproteobacteria bacterium]
MSLTNFLLAAFISLAQAARQHTATVTREELLRRAQLRCDFGAVARKHPVDSAIEVSRTSAVTTIVADVNRCADTAKPLIIEGPPGQGKSWVCKQVLENLKSNDWLIAEHYCFLGDGDTDRNERVLTEAVIGSLLGRLAEAEPEIVESRRPILAADEAALRQAINQALYNQPNRRIALVIDGLDHVTRVIGATISRPDPAQLLATALAELELPPGCVLVVLSQPGVHLQPLQNIGAKTVKLPPLDASDLQVLCERLEIFSMLDINDQPTVDEFVSALMERTNGNALYATYLCRETLRSSIAHVDLVSAIKAFPPFDGTLETYYKYLIDPLGDSARFVAQMVALLEFAVTRNDLGEIAPEYAHHIDAAVAALGPVLVESAAQGGIRVYHESFARFVRSPLENNNAGKHALLKKAQDWLSHKGIFQDARAFRFLLLLCRRLGTDYEVLRIVDETFVSKAIQNGFFAGAIKANLAVAVYCAARIKDWPSVVRCVELARAAETYENERLDNLIEYADVPIALLGSNIFAERLLFDDQPTVPPRAGLLLCAAIDAAGATAPWPEYLEAFTKVAVNDNTSYGADSDRQVAIAKLRGKLRTTTKPDWTKYANWITQNALVSQLVFNAVRDTHGILGVRQLAEALNDANFWLIYAEHMAIAEDSESRVEAQQIARRALSADVAPGTVHRFIALGLKSCDIRTGRITNNRDEFFTLTSQIQQSRGNNSPENVCTWLDGCAIAAHAAPDLLQEVASRIRSPGWYPCWLRFAVALCSAEAAKSNQSKAALQALKLLTEERGPFVGDPRACDLYQLHGIIADTLYRATKLIDDAEWPAAIETLRRVSSQISFTLSGELGGPVPADLLLAIAVDGTTPTRHAVTKEVIDWFQSEQIPGNYYSDIVNFHLAASRYALSCNDPALACENWHRAAKLLSAYGGHKDITIYELLYSVETLIDLNIPQTRQRLQFLQPLCKRVVRHTDKDETRAAPGHWWKLLAAADPNAAAKTIATKLLSDCNQPDDLLETARYELWQAHFQLADPMVAGALRLTLDTGLSKYDYEALNRLTDYLSSYTSYSNKLL